MASDPVDQNETTSSLDKGDIGPFLNKAAVVVIVVTIIILLASLTIMLLSVRSKDIMTTTLNLKLDSVHISKFDTAFIIANNNFIQILNGKMDSLKQEAIKLKDIKSDIEDVQKKNEDYFKLILALVGSVFAIVGFFGFKSISDTRQATLDAAKIKAETVADSAAKNKAESTAKEYLAKEGAIMLTASATKTATEVANQVSTTVAYSTATTTAKSIASEEVRKYFADHKEFKEALQQDITMLEKEYNTLRARMIEIENKIFGFEPPDEEKLPENSQPDVEPEV